MDDMLIHLLYTTAPLHPHKWLRTDRKELCSKLTFLSRNSNPGSVLVVEMSEYDIYWEAGRLGWKLKQQLLCNLESKIHRAGWKNRNPGKICGLGS